MGTKDEGQRTKGGTSSQVRPLDATHLAVRPAIESDVPFLVALRRSAMDPHLLVAGIVLDDEDTKARVLARFDCASMIAYRGQPIGLLKILREKDAWSILQLQLLPEFQNSGLGTALVKQVLAEARAAGVRTTLHVLKRNPARALYERLGFVVVSEDDLEYHMEAEGQA